MKLWIAHVVLLATLAASPAFSQERRRQPDTKGPSELEAHAARMEHDALEDLKVGKLSTGRFVDLDMVFPTDRAEYDAVGKNLLLVFTLFSNDAEELPLAHAYAGDTPLKCMKSVSRDVPPESATAKSFGRFRADTLCLLPIDLKRKNDEIRVDFAKGEEGLEVMSTHFEEPDFVKSDSDSRTPQMPDPAALREFMDREYPGFGFQVSP